MAFNNGYNSYSSFRQEDGKVIGRIRTGVKTASPAAGELDYRFFVEPLSPLPRGYEEARRLGFTGFMSRVGYDCNFFPQDKDAWKALESDWAQSLVLFTPALRNNKYFVIDDAQKEAEPLAMEDGVSFLPVPVFDVDGDPAFDGDLNKFCWHMMEGKPLPGLSRKYWDRNQRPVFVAASFRQPDSRRKQFVFFSPMQEDAFQNVVISEGGAYFGADHQELGWRVVDLNEPDIHSRIVLCRTAPLCFLPETLIPFLKEGRMPVPEDGNLLRLINGRKNGNRAAGRTNGDKSARTEAAAEADGQEPAKKQGEKNQEKGRKSAEKAAQKKDDSRKQAAEAKAREEKAEKPEKAEKAEKQKKTEKQDRQEKPEAAAAPAEKAAPVPEVLTEKAFLKRLERAARNKGLLYSPRDLINFHVALKVSCLVILAGMSGTGKSGLVRLYADAMGLPKEQAVMIPVRPSWMDDSDLLGYLDMKNMIYRPADTGLAELLVDAARHPEKMYIVCFDEMNLARAEHYFAQFISVLEQEEHRVIRLYNPSLMPRIYNSASYPAEIPVGKNVIFTGTVNVDESTYHFSDKILDRANVITLHQGKFRDLAKLERTEAERWPEVSASEWEAFRRTSDTVALTETELDFLDALNEALQQGGLQGGIGYRVARQMGRYLLNIPEGTEFTRADGLDCQTVQRVFTKLRGSGEQLQSLAAADEKGRLTGDAAAVLDRFSRLSSFTESRKVLLRKARELKLYDYTF